MHDKAVSTCDARAVEQRVDRHRIGAVVCRRVEPHVREVGEFFRLASLCDVQRNAACRQAVLIQLADGAEVRRTQEGHPVVLLPVELLLVAQAALLEAEASEAAAGFGPIGQLACGAVGGHVEVRRVVDDLARGAFFHNVHVHGRAEERAQVEERHRKLPRAIGKQRVCRVELDLAVGFVVDLGEDIGRRRGGRRVLLAGHRAGALDQRIERKRCGIAQFDAAGGQCFGRDAERCQRGGNGGGGKKGSTCDHRCL